MKIPFLLVALALIAGCGGGSSITPPPPPPPLGPANVVVSSPVVQWLNATTDKVTVHVKNTGGDGAYSLTFIGLPSSPNGPDNVWGSTTPVQVTSPYEENVSYNVPVNSSPGTDFIVVYNRGTNTANFTKTQCVLANPSLTSCNR